MVSEIQIFAHKIWACSNVPDPDRLAVPGTAIRSQQDYETAGDIGVRSMAIHRESEAGLQCHEQAKSCRLGSTHAANALNAGDGSAKPF